MATQASWKFYTPVTNAPRQRPPHAWCWAKGSSAECEALCASARPSCPVGPSPVCCVPQTCMCKPHVCRCACNSFELRTVNASLLHCACRDRPQLLGAAPGAAGGRRPPPRLYLDARDGSCRHAGHGKLGCSAAWPWSTTGICEMQARQHVADQRPLRLLTTFSGVRRAGVRQRASKTCVPTESRPVPQDCARAVPLGGRQTRCVGRQALVVGSNFWCEHAGASQRSTAFC